MPERKSPIQEGERAPDFTLKDQNGDEFKLSAVKSKGVLLSFHPLAWTNICAKQMQSLEANTDTFASLNVIPVGISIDSVPTKKAWAESLHIKITRLLSDFWPHGSVAGLYGVFREYDGFSERANIIIDESQKVVFAKVYPTNQLPDVTELVHFLEH